MVSRSKVAMAATVAELEHRHSMSPAKLAEIDQRMRTLPYMKYAGEDDVRYWTTQTDAQFMTTAYDALQGYKYVLQEYKDLGLPIDHTDDEVVTANEFLQEAGREAKRRWGIGGAKRWWSACGVKAAGATPKV